MTLLIKDHKQWDLIPKTRSVMGGNVGGNTGISEFLSLVLEPVAREQDGSMEINATNGLLADICDLNDEMEKEVIVENFILEENPTILEEEEPNTNEVVSIREEDGQKESNVDGTLLDHTARGGADWTLPLAVPDKGQTDIRQFLKVLSNLDKVAFIHWQ